MKTPSQEDQWREVEEALRIALEHLRGEISGEDIDLFEEFIENREYEIAHHFISSVIARTGVRVDATVLRALGDVARLLNL